MYAKHASDSPAVSSVVELASRAASDFLIVISKFSLKILVRHLLMTLISAY